MKKTISIFATVLTITSAYAQDKEAVVDGKASKEGKATDADAIKQKVSNLVSEAIKAQRTKDFKKASDILYQAYELDTSNKNYLYYAASNSLTAKDYDKALTYYEALRKENYTGVKTRYFAVNKSTGLKEAFSGKEVRDIAVKSGSHQEASEVKTKSKLPEIVKNISWIYLNHVRDSKKALAAVNEAIAANPNDVSLQLTKGQIHYIQGEKDKFKKTMQAIIAKHPNDVDSHYNIAVVCAETGEIEEARAIYMKVLKLNPKYVNAGINLSKTYLDEAAKVVDEMNKLGMSDADNKKFEALKTKQTELYKESLKVLEPLSKNVPDNIQILRQLKGLYSFLGEDDKFKSVQSKLSELGQ